MRFLTDTVFGKKHDKRLADEAGYTVPEGSLLYQDTGFQGFSIEGVTIIQPKKKPKGGELTSEEKENNRLISSIRIRIEHAIGGVKRPYRILRSSPSKFTSKLGTGGASSSKLTSKLTSKLGTGGTGATGGINSLAERGLSRHRTLRWC
ncbi:MAG: hypothetical protein O7E52_04905 [Candidatus Poribacteria bacterium]|nr:hypothetical protein [Candidatus Poribacteria bacterium]